ncbi:MAG: transporter associated domain-containing protein [Halieaceae bacterium]|nr:transporter associated domain-containing protein [Halieaceae bacterium]
MNEERSGNDTQEKGWLERLALIFNSEPRTRQDLSDVLEIARDNEVIDDDAQSIIEGAMQVAELQARDIMIPRSQMEVIKAEYSLAELLPQVIQSAHSRYPVIGDSPDDVLGILLVKDLLPQILEPQGEDFDLTSLLRPCTVVPESKRLNVLLREFRQNRNHMAIVIDEYGGVAGLVTIEDVLEEIVGEIEDETDLATDTFIRQLGNGDYIVRALTPIEDFNEAFKTDFSDDEFDTIGGLVMQQFGHLPSHNETTEIDGLVFKVVNADQRKIHSLRVRVQSD